MSIENIEKLYKKLAQDQTLREQVMAKAETMKKDLGGDEKKSLTISGKELEKGFAILKPVAEKAGLPFTLEEFKKYAASMQEKAKSSELTDEELSAVAGGGTTACWLVGFGFDGGKGFCLIFGYAGDSTGHGICFAIGGQNW